MSTLNNQLNSEKRRRLSWSATLKLRAHKHIANAIFALRPTWMWEVSIMQDAVIDLSHGYVACFACAIYVPIFGGHVSRLKTKKARCVSNGLYRY